MKFIDTHTHLYLQNEFGEESKSVVQRAIESGVEQLIFPNVDLSTINPMIDLHGRFKDNTHIALGLHPTEVRSDWCTILSEIRPMFIEYNCVAVGEVGIDLYWDKTYRDEQMQAFETQLYWAEDMELPVIVHCRDGLNETLEVIEGFCGNLPKIVFHSFTGSKAEIERIKQAGDFYFGINGVVTFKNAQDLRDALPAIGLEKILLETDSPYLTPAPYRGKRNESSNIPLIAMKIAETLGVAVEHVAKVTSDNASLLFKI